MNQEYNENKDKQKKKEKIIKTFLKKKTYDFCKLQGPSNYGEIEKYWNYEKNILDYNILDFTSKSNLILYIILNFSYI